MAEQKNCALLEAERLGTLAQDNFAGTSTLRGRKLIQGAAGDGRSPGPRLQALVRGFIYVSLCVTTFSFIGGRSQQGQSQQQVTLTARVMKHAYGRWLIGIVCVIVVVVGLGMVVEGVTKKFQKQLRMQAMSRRTRTVVLRLGTVGTIARGLVSRPARPRADCVRRLRFRRSPLG
jgi:ABC-type Fe3+ transport system permease subunit